MISVIVWLPLRMPRSVETSKITAWVGMCSPIVLRSTVIASSPMRAASRSAAPSPASGRFSSASPRYLAKLDLPEPKKPETQTPMPSCGLFGVSRVALEDRAEVRADRVGGDVLGELVADELLVGLVDLDDLFDVPLDVAGEEVFDDGWRSSSGSFLEDLRSVVVLGVEDAHEAEARGAVELARIEEHGGNVHLALELLEQRRGAVDGEERARPDDEDDVAKRVGVAGDALRQRGRRAARTR